MILYGAVVYSILYVLVCKKVCRVLQKGKSKGLRLSECGPIVYCSIVVYLAVFPQGERSCQGEFFLALWKKGAEQRGYSYIPYQSRERHFRRHRKKKNTRPEIFNVRPFRAALSHPIC